MFGHTPSAYDARVSNTPTSPAAPARSHLAVLFDFGGVILSSPFDAFNEYEAASNLPKDFIRSVNTTNPDSNAWARLERNELSPAEFDDVFAEESAALGHRVPGRDVLGLLDGSIRPEMVDLLDRVKAAGYRTACLTNNTATSDSDRDHHRRAEVRAVMDRFDHVVESSVVGVRKPEPRFYEIACELLNVTPADCVFLDDLGINLKPAAAMGMTTIKVTSAAQAIDDLTRTLNL
jgi:putative hydrolase of the HAD superfamily